MAKHPYYLLDSLVVLLHLLISLHRDGRYWVLRVLGPRVRDPRTQYLDFEPNCTVSLQYVGPKYCALSQSKVNLQK